MSATLILASTSPYRRDLLARLGLPFETISPDVDEALRESEAPRQRAERLAREKALAGSRLAPGATVIAGDQVAALGSRVLRTPGTVDRARKQLLACRGEAVDFYSALALARDDALLALRCVPVVVQFRDLKDAEVDRYLELEPALDCAGSFRWESLGITLFKHIQSDDPTALTGLPLIALCELLREQGFDPLATVA